jgi:hypothetical protein
LLAEFICHLSKIISLLYEIIFWLKFGTWIGFESEIQQNLVCLKWTYVAQDIQIGMTYGQHCQIARFDFEGCDFHALPYFIFFP